MWDNFFALGGDSLQSTAAVLRVNELFEIECPMSVVFLHPTLDRLAEQVRQRLRPERLACLGQALRENPAGEQRTGLRMVRLKMEGRGAGAAADRGARRGVRARVAARRQGGLRFLLRRSGCGFWRN